MVLLCVCSGTTILSVHGLRRAWAVVPLLAAFAVALVGIRYLGMPVLLAAGIGVMSGFITLTLMWCVRAAARPAK